MKPHAHLSAHTLIHSHTLTYHHMHAHPKATLTPLLLHGFGSSHSFIGRRSSVAKNPRTNKKAHHQKSLTSLMFTREHGKGSCWPRGPRRVGSPLFLLQLPLEGFGDLCLHPTQRVSVSLMWVYFLPFSPCQQNLLRMSGLGHVFTKHRTQLTHFPRSGARNG